MGKRLEAWVRKNWELPGYTWFRDLGEGSAGRVVLAIHRATGVAVAIKYFSERLLADEAFLIRFRAEADVLSRLGDPNLVRFYEYIESIRKDMPVGAPPVVAAVVMELVDGVSLAWLIKTERSIGPEAALAILKDSLLGLAAIHSVDVLHRDCKPGNILIRDDGTSTLVDVGIAGPTAENVPAGSPAYMPPEQWSGEPITPASDIYAATAVFFECMTGSRPFKSRTSLEQVPEVLRGLVIRGMAKAANDRPQSAMAFLEEIETTAQTAYGPDWEESGRNRLIELAAHHAAQFPLASSPQRSRGNRSEGNYTRRLILGMITAIAAMLLLAGTGVISAYQSPVSLQAANAGVNGSLFESSVVIPHSAKSPMGKHLLMSVYVCGPEVAISEGCPPSDAERLGQHSVSGPSTVNSQRPLKAAGRIRAELISTGSEVHVQQMGSGIEPLRSRSDWATWAWSVTGNKAGTYVLILGLTILKGGTNEALYPTRYYQATITITVKHTVGEAVNAVGRVLQHVVTWLVAIAGGLGALGIGSVLVERFARKRRRHDNDEDRTDSSNPRHAKPAEGTEVAPPR